MGAAIVGLIGALAAAGVGIYQGYKSSKNVEETNESNKQIAQETNEANVEQQNKTSLFNYYLNKQNNEANAAIANSTNEANAAAIQQTNEYNKAIQDSINASNIAMNEANNAQNAASVNATNEANYNIQKMTNEANYRMAQEANETNIALTDKNNETQRAIASQTNALNAQIAAQNLGFQREQLDYQKALQNQIFQREDTAYERTALDMSRAGLNPLSMSGTNGAGQVVSTSPLNNQMQYQGYNTTPASVSPSQNAAAVMQAAQFSPSMSNAFSAQAPHGDRYEMKAAQALAAKYEKFNVMAKSYDWLTTTMGQISDMASKTVQHGFQLDELNEMKKNNQVDRAYKLFNMGFEGDSWDSRYFAHFSDDKGNELDPLNPNFQKDIDWSNPSNVAALKRFQSARDILHDMHYGLYGNSTQVERQITGIQNMLDNHKIQKFASSLSDEAINIFQQFQKMYNKVY